MKNRKAATFPLLLSPFYSAACVGSLLSVALFGCIFSIGLFLWVNSIYTVYFSEPHNLKLAFDFNSDILSKALSTITGSLSNPQLSVAFTVKDATTINEKMLRSATINAKRKAEILCSASGTTMGDLISIDYNWGELDIYSNTRYECCDEFRLASPNVVDITPDDIDVSDTATFVWEIK